MNKREYVKFTGLLPKELIGVKKPIYGKVVKRSKSKDFLIVKPKYHRFDVTVAKEDVKFITEETFHKKHKKKKKISAVPKCKRLKAKKTVVKTEKVKKDPVIKPVEKKIIASPIV